MNRFLLSRGFHPNRRALLLVMVRIHIGVGKRRLKTPKNYSNAPNDMSRIAVSSRIDKWLPDVDSNHDSRIQRPLSYH